MVTSGCESNVFIYRMSALDVFFFGNFYEHAELVSQLPAVSGRFS